MVTGLHAVRTFACGCVYAVWLPPRGWLPRHIAWLPAHTRLRFLLPHYRLPHVWLRFTLRLFYARLLPFGYYTFCLCTTATFAHVAVRTRFLHTGLHGYAFCAIALHHVCGRFTAGLAFWILPLCQFCLPFILVTLRLLDYVGCCHVTFYTHVCVLRGLLRYVYVVLLQFAAATLPVTVVTAGYRVYATHAHRSCTFYVLPARVTVATFTRSSTRVWVPVYRLRGLRTYATVLRSAVAYLCRLVTAGYRTALLVVTTIHHCYRLVCSHTATPPRLDSGYRTFTLYYHCRYTVLHGSPGCTLLRWFVLLPLPGLRSDSTYVLCPTFGHGSLPFWLHFTAVARSCTLPLRLRCTVYCAPVVHVYFPLVTFAVAGWLRLPAFVATCGYYVWLLHIVRTFTFTRTAAAGCHLPRFYRRVRRFYFYLCRVLRGSTHATRLRSLPRSAARICQHLSRLPCRYLHTPFVWFCRLRTYRFTTFTWLVCGCGSLRAARYWVAHARVTLRLRCGSGLVHVRLLPFCTVYVYARLLTYAVPHTARTHTFILYTACPFIAVARFLVWLGYLCYVIPPFGSCGWLHVLHALRWFAWLPHVLPFLRFGSYHTALR